ncbi:carbon-nitrogen hydrolase family protein [Cryptosporangium aurantiacum]|uniref:Predicted amidohydrolase n=1 Tax=Cryptosporangium aurantiacum TaxID=134849 RepID=A0A1M7N7G4_9ACTN|nr:carbon-nitrogen hydrolase family protein [Cryptosporangium aurantiacum]SHM99523.1 Predicted amidohydrolase [Cryptosporangium aurantiacum]
MKAFTAAAIQVAPEPGPLTPATVAANLERCADYVRRCVEETGAELLVLPETATTGFTTGVSPDELWDVVSEIPGPVTAPVQEVARELGVHVVLGTYERGYDRGTVYNTAALIGPTGDVLGTYRKTHLFCGEGRGDGGWVTPGDRAIVVDTELGKIGLIICFDGDYPELSRIEAVLGAEVICRPSALLRSADLWELTSRARAYDNHVFLVGANATGVDPGGTIYFGNSLIVTPIAEVLARGASHQGWVTARLDPETAMSSLTPGSSVKQRFDHLADRSLTVIERHMDELRAPAKTPFPHG